MEQSDRIMRRNRKLALALAAAWVLAVLGSLAADRFPLNRAFLQSHLDGNQKDGTNFGTLAATNFAGNGAGLTNVPLSALAQSGADTNQVPKWNGVAWAPGTVSGGFDWTNVWQYGSANLTNWSALGTNAFEWRYQAGDGDLTNWSQLATNAFEWRYQAGDATLTNLASLNSASEGQVIKWTSGAWAVGDDLTGGSEAYYGPFTNLFVYSWLYVTNTAAGGAGHGIELAGTNRVVSVGYQNSWDEGTQDSLLVGEGVEAVNATSVLAVGDNAKVTDNNNGAAIGNSAFATNNGAIAIGDQTVAGGPKSVAIGTKAYALGERSIVINAVDAIAQVDGTGNIGIKGNVVDIEGNVFISGVLHSKASADPKPILLTNTVSETEVFSVSTNGQVTASGYVGDGSGLTNVVASSFSATNSAASNSWTAASATQFRQEYGSESVVITNGQVFASRGFRPAPNTFYWFDDLFGASPWVKLTLVNAAVDAITMGTDSLGDSAAGLTVAEIQPGTYAQLYFCYGVKNDLPLRTTNQVGFSTRVKFPVTTDADRPMFEVGIGKVQNNAANYTNYLATSFFFRSISNNLYFVAWSGGAARTTNYLGPHGAEWWKLTIIPSTTNVLAYTNDVLAANYAATMSQGRLAPYIYAFRDVGSSPGYPKFLIDYIEMWGTCNRP